MLEKSEATFLRRQAARCRGLAAAINDPGVSAALRSMAQENEARAAELENVPHRPRMNMPAE